MHKHPTLEIQTCFTSMIDIRDRRVRVRACACVNKLETIVTQNTVVGHMALKQCVCAIHSGQTVQVGE